MTPERRLKLTPAEVFAGERAEIVQRDTISNRERLQADSDIIKVKLKQYTSAK